MTSSKRSLLFVGSSFCALLYLLFNDVLTWQVYLLPIMFILLYPSYDAKLSKLKTTYYSLIVVLFIYWFRLVVLPVLAYSIKNETHIDYGLPIFLTLYEFLAVSVFILSSKCERGWNAKVKLQGNVSVYVIYGLIAVLVYFLFARGMGMFEFIVKEVNTEERGGDLEGTRTLIIRQLVNCGMLFTYLLLIVRFSNKYTRLNSRKYLYYALLISLIFISIISGERRTSIIYKAFAVFVVLIQLFPSQKQKITRFIAITALVILVFMTIYKSFHAYMYSSYFEALNSRQPTEALGGGAWDSYFFGIQTIAKNIEFIEKNTLSIGNLVYDFFRSIFGIHFFVKDSGFTTSQLYNLSLYDGGQTNGYLFASISYGYAYFGLLLAPVVSLTTVFFMTKIEYLMHKVASVEMLYICAIIFMRLAFGFMGDPTSLLNMTTQVFVIYGGFYFISRLCRFR